MNIIDNRNDRYYKYYINYRLDLINRLNNATHEKLYDYLRSKVFAKLSRTLYDEICKKIMSDILNI